MGDQTELDCGATGSPQWLSLSSRAGVRVRCARCCRVTAGSFACDALGLIDESPDAEERRNIVLTPFWSPEDGSVELAAALATSLTAPDAPRLPAKFGFAIDCGPLPVLSHVPADIRLERSVDGGLICRASGAALPEIFAEVPTQSDATFSPKPGSVAAGFLVGFDFGQVPADLLSALSGLGALRVTPWRMLLIEGASAAPDLPGLITCPHDPMLRVIACTGAPGCLQAAQPTRALARSLAPHLPDGAVLHVSGCAKGCAHAGPAVLTLTAQAEGFDLIRDGRARDVAQRRGLTAEFLAAHPAILREAL